MDPERLDILLERRWDQALTAEERSELEAMLLESPKARQRFWQSARWHGMLRQWGEASWGRDLDGVRKRDERPADGITSRCGYRLAWVSAGVAIGLLAACWYWWMSPRDAKGPSPKAATLAGRAGLAPPMDVGLLTRVFEAECRGSGMPGQVGEMLGPSRIRLDSGMLEVETLRGARLVIEGPADVELVAENEIVLRSGKIRVTVPESARGITVSSARFELVDRSGAFGCVVPETGPTEIHVFQGSVELTDRARKTQHVLQAGRSRILTESDASDSEANPAKFASDADLNRLAEEGARRQLEAWRDSSREMDRREDLRVHLDFEDGRRGTRMLSNRAVHAPAGSGASLVGCDWVEGRWRGKGAVEFKHQSDRLWLNVAEVLESATFLAWVRVDSLPNSLHALLTAQGPGGRVHWALRESGSLAFGIEVPNDGRGWLIHRSERKVQPQQFGTWLCLVTVVAADGTVNHYINGEPAGHGRLIERKTSKLGRLGNCEIGNTARATNSPPTTKETASSAERPRNFVGRMDEFAIFSSALDANEIRRLYVTGRYGHRWETADPLEGDPDDLDGFQNGIQSSTSPKSPAP